MAINLIIVHKLQRRRLKLFCTVSVMRSRKKKYFRDFPTCTNLQLEWIFMINQNEEINLQKNTVQWKVTEEKCWKMLSSCCPREWVTFQQFSIMTRLPPWPRKQMKRKHFFCILSFFIDTTHVAGFLRHGNEALVLEQFYFRDSFDAAARFLWFFHAQQRSQIIYY